MDVATLAHRPDVDRRVCGEVRRQVISPLALCMERDHHARAGEASNDEDTRARSSPWRPGWSSRPSSWWLNLNVTPQPRRPGNAGRRRPRRPAPARGTGRRRPRPPRPPPPAAGAAGHLRRQGERRRGPPSPSPSRTAQAIAYLCDGKSTEAWLQGTAANGELVLTGADNATPHRHVRQRRGQRHRHGRRAGRGRSRVKAVKPPSGLYRAAANVRNAQFVGGWIVLADGDAGRPAAVLGGVASAVPPLNPASRHGPVDGTASPSTPVDGTNLLEAEPRCRRTTAARHRPGLRAGLRPPASGRRRRCPATAAQRRREAASCRSSIGGAVAVALGVYGRLHEPTVIAVNIAGLLRPAGRQGLAHHRGGRASRVVQLVSALAMYGKLGVAAPSWSGTLHRWSGRIAFLLAVPVAIHCLYAVGFSTSDAAGAGALAARLLLLRRVHREDARAVPQGHARLGAAAARRAGLHRPGRAVADLVAVVLHQRRREVLTIAVRERDNA